MRIITQTNPRKKIALCFFIKAVMLSLSLCAFATEASNSLPFAIPPDSQVIQAAIDELQQQYGVPDDVLRCASIIVRDHSQTALGDIICEVVIEPDDSHSIFETLYIVTVHTGDGVSEADSRIKLGSDQTDSNLWPGFASIVASRGKAAILVKDYGEEYFLQMLPSQQAYFTQAISDALDHWPEGLEKTYRYETNKNNYPFADKSLAYAKRLFMEMFSLPEEALDLFDISTTALYNHKLYENDCILSIEFVPNVYQINLASHVYTLSAKNGTLLAYQLHDRNPSNGWRGEQIGKLHRILVEARRMGEENGIYGIWSEEGYAAYSALWEEARINNLPYVYHTRIEPDATLPIQKGDVDAIATKALAGAVSTTQEQYPFLHSIVLYGDDPANPIWCAEYTTRTYTDESGMNTSITHYVYISPQTGEVIRIREGISVG